MSENQRTIPVMCSNCGAPSDFTAEVTPDEAEDAQVVRNYFSNVYMECPHCKRRLIPVLTSRGGDQ